MFSEMKSFWDALPADFKSFVVGVSSKMTADFLMSSGKAKTDDISGALNEAYQEGIKYCVKRLCDNNVDLDYIKHLLEDNEVKSLFLSIANRGPDEQDATLSNFQLKSSE